MKKAGILAILFACFTFAFALPAASANNWKNVDNAVTNDNVGTNRAFNRVENDLDRATDRLETGANRTANRVENGVNRATNRAEQGLNRAFGTDAYDRTGTTDSLNNNMLNRANYRTTAATTTANRGFSWGWLGLLGLIGLAGMRNKERDRA